MENSLLDMELKSLIINELTQGKEMAKELEINLNARSSSPEVCDILVNNIIDSYNRILSIVKPVDALQGGDRNTIIPMMAVGKSESPRSPSGSPRSQDLDMEFKDHDRNISDASKKRKAMPRWSKKVEVYPGSVSEGPLLDDGHNWRKYGQKDILGARYPRGYYRCTQRHAQGCLATKQVQRTDDNPTIFEITYRGRHSCSPKTSSSKSASAPEKQQQLNAKDHINIIDMHHQDQQALLVSSFETGLKVDNDTKNQHFPKEMSFNFPSTSSNNVLAIENYPFSPNCLIDEELALNFQNYYTDNLHVQITDQELMESTTTSGENSPNVDLDYPFSMFTPTFPIW